MNAAARCRHRRRAFGPHPRPHCRRARRHRARRRGRSGRSLLATASPQEASTRAVADYRELIGEIDAAIIATPTNAPPRDRHGAARRAACRCSSKSRSPLTSAAGRRPGQPRPARRASRCKSATSSDSIRRSLAVAADVRDPKYIEATRTSGYTFRSTDIGVVHRHDDPRSGHRALAREIDRRSTCRPSASRCSAGTKTWPPPGSRSPAAAWPSSTASRVSFQQQRTMIIFTSRGSASINFATHEATRREAERRSAAARVPRRSTDRRRARVLERTRLRSSFSSAPSAMPSQSTRSKKSSATSWPRFAPAKRRASTARPAAMRSPSPR